MFKKRCLSFLLACCMTLTFLPPPVALASYDGMSTTDADAVEDMSDAPDMVLEAVEDVSGEALTDADDVADMSDAPGMVLEAVEDVSDEAPTDADNVADMSDTPGMVLEAVEDVSDEAPTDADDVADVSDAPDMVLEAVEDVSDEASTDTEAETVYQITVPVTFEDPDAGEEMATLLDDTNQKPFELPTELPGYVPEARLLADSSDTKTYYYFRGLTNISISGIPVDYNGTIDALKEGLLQVVDSNGKILLSVSYSSYSSSYNRYHYSYNRTYDSETQQYIYSNYTLSVHYYWYDTALLTIGNTYKLQLVIGEEIYPCKAEIVPVDGYYLSSASLGYLYTSDTTFSASLSLYGFRTEDDLSKLKLELLDGDGENANVIATSTGNYHITNVSYYPSKALDSTYISLSMELKLASGAELQTNQSYYLRISSVEKPLYTNLGMSPYSASTYSTAPLSIEEARLIQLDPAKVQVKLGEISQNYLDEGCDVLLVASSITYSSYSSDSMESILTSNLTYGSARFKKNELPTDKVVTLSLHNSRRDSDSAYTMGYIYVNAFFVKEDENGETTGRFAMYMNVRNPSISYDNTGSYSFYPDYVSTTTTTIPFSMSASGWDSVYHTYEDNVVELRKGEDTVIATCSDIQISYAQSQYAATLTGEFKIANSPLEKGAYDIYYNGKRVDTLQVIDKLRHSELMYSDARYYEYNYSDSRFWTQFGAHHQKFRINGGTGSGALVFRKDGTDTLSSGTIQGTKTAVDEWTYEFSFTAEQLKALTADEKYSLIFRDANEQEISIFSSYSYYTETVWPERIDLLQNLH